MKNEIYPSACIRIFLKLQEIIADAFVGLHNIMTVYITLILDHFQIDLIRSSIFSFCEYFNAFLYSRVTLMLFIIWQFFVVPFLVEIQLKWYSAKNQYSNLTVKPIVL